MIGKLVSLRAVTVSLLYSAAMVSASVHAEDSAGPESLMQMSLQQLGDIEVTSVSKSPQQVRHAPAAIYVITHDDIVRAAATSVPEALRLAPNLLVTQLSASNYVVAARGFGGNPDDQNFANKMLVLIDGRSVYSPLFSGVYLDSQDVVLEDVERIEVISGPGATLWGANAMNGVINIITRAADLTRGALLSADAGNLQRNMTARYGDNLGAGAFRVYGKAFKYDAMEQTDGSDAHDGWSKAQGGFRYDWSGRANTLTLQGDAYRTIEDQSVPGDLHAVGANALTRWQHQSDNSQFQVQAYYDLTERISPPGSGAFALRTYDVEVQESLSLGALHKIVLGAGERINSYHITNTPTLLFVPDNRALTLGNVFAQDTLALTGAVNLTVGIKLEDDPYSGWAAQPDLRLAWQPSDTTMLWAAASRAIRSPTPFDTDVVEKLGTLVYLVGDATFKPERVTAYEVGYRGQPAAQLSLSVSAFYNVYDDLRTIEPASGATFIPLHWGNLMQGDTYGAEAWVQWRITDHWQLFPSVRLLHQNLQFKAGASQLLGVAQAGNDPTSQASLRSTLSLGERVSIDASLRYVGALPSPALPAYHELNTRISWQVAQALEISLSGFNLLHARHLEFPEPSGDEIVRSVVASARWTF